MEDRNNYKLQDLFIFGVFLLNTMVFIWYYRFLPLQDYPDWLLQGFLFFKALHGQLPHNYSLITYPVPNSISTFVIGGLDTLFHPEVSGKIFLSINALLFFSGSTYLLGVYDTKKTSFIYYLPVLLIFNPFFFHGYINYYFGLSVLFWGFGYVMRRPLDVINPLAILCITVLLFYSHAMVYGIFLLYLLISLIVQNNRKTIRNVALGVSCSLVLSVLYAINHVRYTKFSPDIPGKIHAFNFPGFEDTLQYFSIFHSFYPFSDSRILFISLANTLNHLFCYSIIVILLFGLVYIIRTKSKDRALLIVLGISILFYLFSPNAV
jgi:hypothetical protein